MLNVIMLSVANKPFMLSVVMLSIVMLNVVAPNKQRRDTKHNAHAIYESHENIITVMPSVIMLNVIVVTVVAPNKQK